MGFGLGFCCCTAASVCDRSYLLERFDSFGSLDPLWEFDSRIDVEGTDFNVNGVFEFLTTSPNRYSLAFARWGESHLRRLTPLYAARGESYRFAWESWLNPLATTPARREELWVEVYQSPLYGAFPQTINNELLVSHRLTRRPDPGEAEMVVVAEVSEGLPGFYPPNPPTPSAQATYTVPRADWGNRRQVVVEWVPVSRVRIDFGGTYLMTYQYFSLRVEVDGTEVLSVLAGRVVEPRGGIVGDRPGNWDCDEFSRIRSGHYYEGGLGDLTQYVNRAGERFIDNFLYESF